MTVNTLEQTYRATIEAQQAHIEALQGSVRASERVIAAERAVRTAQRSILASAVTALPKMSEIRAILDRALAALTETQLTHESESADAGRERPEAP